ncbi:hypothetical protein PY546_05060 [Providencia stuartii]|nr:hypothetical protein [Providencia stuartii]
MLKITQKQLRNAIKKGYDDQYDKNESNIYLGKDLVERYKGTNPADVLNSAVGVYSGDARNSGALDPNIRGDTRSRASTSHCRWHRASPNSVARI